MEVLQYVICTDESGRLTTRNRCYLRRYNPHSSPPSPTVHPLPYNIYTAPQPHLDIDPTPPATTPTTKTIHFGASSPTHGPTPPSRHWTQHQHCHSQHRVHCPPQLPLRSRHNPPTTPPPTKRGPKSLDRYGNSPHILISRLAAYLGGGSGL